MSLSGTVTTSVMWLVAAATFIWAVVSLAKATGTLGASICGPPICVGPEPS